MESNEEKKGINPERDWVLQMIVNIVNNSKGAMSIGVSLVTHGFVVSGSIVSGEEYFKGLGEEAASGSKEYMESLGNTFKNSLEALGKKIYGENSEEKKSENVSFIHLKNAKFYHPSGKPIPNNTGVWWRGRISEVSGFSLGAMSVN